jgi:hypothetical protein
MICLILFVTLLFIEQYNFKECAIVSMWYFIVIGTPFFFLQTQWKDYENVKALMEILLYVIDNKLLEVYCQVIISIWVVLYRCTWSYKNSGQLKHNEIECQVLWTLNRISRCCMNSPTGCDVHRPRYISSNVNDAGCNLWNPFG